jgi:hypothetical protein
MRRTFNQAFFREIFVDDDYKISSELAEPFNRLLDKNLLEEASASRKQTTEENATAQYCRTFLEVFREAAEKSLVGIGVSQDPQFVGGWSVIHLVGAGGLEPSTSAV